MDMLLKSYEHFCWTVTQALFFIGPFGDLIWPVMGLLPLLLIAMAVGGFDTRLQPGKVSRTIRIILISQPLLWVIACAIFIPFWNDAEKDQETVTTVIGWINWCLIALLVLPGLSAVAVSRGFNRLVTGLFLVVNLWLLLACSFVGLMAVSGTWI